ncbi:MAG: CopG family transcriptional regulator [bacterium]|nr:CopG family transcriptional regulator [bacterium]
MPKPRKPGAPLVRTTLELPPALWRAAKIRAMDERRDLRAVIIDALRAYLATPKGGSA